MTASLLRAVREFLTTTRMALAFGFGLLLTLVVLSGLNAVHAITVLQSSSEDILRQYVARDARLDQLRSEIYLSGTYVRDYLLEPDPAKAEQSRLALSETRRQIQSLVGSASSASDTRSREMHVELENQIREYWRTLDPVLTWDAAQRHRDGYGFLRDEVLPRRSNMLGIADTIASVNQRQLVERDRKLLAMFSGLRTRLLLAIGVMFLSGLLLACATALHILRLQARTLAHLEEVTEARQELRDLSARLVETQENERKNLSRELHDAVGQSLSAVQFELHDLRGALSASGEALRTRVDRIRELVESSVAMVRNMALLLRPSMLDDLGLAAALEWQAHQIARSTGLQIGIAADELPRLPEEHKICIFRIVQEALNNVCRHAMAGAVEVAVHIQGEQISVTVRDDGRGFRTPRRSGLGLVGMHERVESLGGRLSVHSEPGKGATIEAVLPLPQAVSPAASARNNPWSDSRVHFERLCRDE